MKKLITILIALVLGISAFAQINQWDLVKTYNSPISINGFACNEKYVFFIRNNNDTIYTLDITTMVVIHKEKTGLVGFALVVKNNKLFCSMCDAGTLTYYDISNINTWNKVQTLTGLDKGWVISLGTDTSYIDWA